MRIEPIVYLSAGFPIWAQGFPLLPLKGSINFTKCWKQIWLLKGCTMTSSNCVSCVPGTVKEPLPHSLPPAPPALKHSGHTSPSRCYVPGIGNWFALTMPGCVLRMQSVIRKWPWEWRNLTGWAAPSWASDMILDARILIHTPPPPSPKWPNFGGEKCDQLPLQAYRGQFEWGVGKAVQEPLEEELRKREGGTNSFLLFNNSHLSSELGLVDP